MPFDGFDAMRHVDQATLEAVLGGEDAQERVWAAWWLALRGAPSALGATLLATGSEPDPGVRRHLVVLLAGRQQVDILEALAADDPSGEVRADAASYLFRLGRLRGPLLDRLARDSAEVVRLVVARNVDALDDRFYADESVEVCRVVLERVLARSPAAIPAALDARTTHEPDPDLRHRLLEASVRSGRLPARVAEATTPVVLEVLGLWRAAGRRVPWAVLAPLAQRGDLATHVALLELVDPAADDIDWDWMLARATLPRPPHPPRDRQEAMLYWAATRAARGAIGVAIEALELRPGLVPTGPLAALLRFAIDEARDRLRHPDDEYDEYGEHESLEEWAQSEAAWLLRLETLLSRS